MMANPFVIDKNRFKRRTKRWDGKQTGKLGGKIGEKERVCMECPLFFAPGPVHGDGPVDATLWVVGEAPHTTECKTGKPYQGPAGKVLSFLLKVAGVSRENCHVTNVVRCSPRTRSGAPRKPTSREVCYCTERFLLPELARNKPNCVLATGDTAFSALMGDLVDRKITSYRGSVQNITLTAFEVDDVKSDEDHCPDTPSEDDPPCDG